MQHYKIRYIGILQYGYVRLSIVGKNGKPTNRKPTKFRSKLLANFCCFMLNKCDNNFNTFEVVNCDNSF